MLALPQGAAEMAGDGLIAAGPDHGMAGQERGQMRGHADGAHAGAAAAVRDAEGLVQIEMAHVRAHGRRGGKGPPGRSCWRRPCTPGRRASG